MTRIRIQSGYADLRDQLVVMLILTVAIALRSMFVGGGESPRGHFDIPSANEAQHDATHQESSRSEGLRSITTQNGPNLDKSSRDARTIKELQE